MESFTSTTTSTGTTNLWRKFSPRAIRIPNDNGGTRVPPVQAERAARQLPVVRATQYSQLPAAYPSDIHMHEVGTAVVADTPTMQPQRGIPQFSRRNSR